MKLKIGILFFLLVFSISLSGQETLYKQSIKVLSKENNETVPFAYLIITSQNRKLMFSTDANGEAFIQYNNPTMLDSIFVSSIGYENNNFLLSTVKDVILIKQKTYGFNEVVVKPAKTKRIKLGNKAGLGIKSCQISFDTQLVLYIPNDGTNGKIQRIRYYMMSNCVEGSKYIPFRVRVYAKEECSDSVGVDLLNEELIVMLPRVDNNWLDVDISHFNISFPPTGVYIGLEVQSLDFYLKNGYIESKHVYVKSLKTVVVNSPSIGFTNYRKAESGMQTWNYNPYFGGWNQKLYKDHCLLIQILVEKQ